MACVIRDGVFAVMSARGRGSVAFMGSSSVASLDRHPALAGDDAAALSQDQVPVGRALDQTIGHGGVDDGALGPRAPTKALPQRRQVGCPMLPFQMGDE